MRFTGLIVKALPAVCAAGIVMSAGMMCQKAKSEKPQAAAKQAAVESTMTATKKMTADTSMKKADTVAKTTVKDSAAAVAQAGYYTCPMHPKIHQAKPGKCPICGMDLVFKKAAKTTAKVKSIKHRVKKM